MQPSFKDSLSVDDFVDTPIVRCDDGEIVVFPQAGLTEIDGELFSLSQVTELSSVIGRSLEDFERGVYDQEGYSTTTGWLISADEGALLLNGSPITSSELKRHLRSLRYAVRLIDI